MICKAAWMAGLLFASAQLALADGMTLPKTVEAGTAFSIPTTGSGQATLYIVGPGQALKHDVQLGQPVSFAAGDLYNAGHYTAVLVGASSDSGAFDVTPGKQAAAINLLAKPSRLPVGLHNGITGAVYVFDAYQNLILTPTTVSFQLSGGASATQTRSVTTKYGAAWTAMDSGAKESAAQFEARVGDVSSTRIIQQVPGEPCGLSMSAHPAGQKVELETAPIKDCGGNAVPEGTIVTFTESYDGTQTTVDVPIKRGTARAEMPAYSGARISVATGVVLGNEIRLGGR